MNKLRYFYFVISSCYLLVSCVFFEKKSNINRYKNVKISEQICNGLKTNQPYNGFYIESNKGKVFYHNFAYLDSLRFENKKDLSYEDIKDVEKITKPNGITVVRITFNELGAKKLSDITAKNIDKRIGVLIKGELITAPKIMSPINGGKVEITGRFKPSEIDRVYQYFAKIVKCKAMTFMD